MFHTVNTAVTWEEGYSPRMMESITHFIKEDVQLFINQKKSEGCGATSETFLGFNIQNLTGKLDTDQVSRQNNVSKKTDEFNQSKTTW